MSARPLELSVVLPCLNEARTVAACVRKALEVCRAEGLEAEVIVADNGSSDGSQSLAREAGARVVEVAERGYGAALKAGFAASRTALIVMGDADDSYEFGDIPAFVARLRLGDELVIGSRFQGRIEPGAMPFLHRWLGNPVLTWILNLFFGAGISDAHCGMRAFRREAVERLDLRSRGMEFASEMIVRAAQEKLRIGEVPTTLRKDGRDRKPHLNTWSDGWRHLRFLLLFSPLWLFLVPGLVLGLFGLLLTTLVALSTLSILGHRLNTHFALLGSALAIIGLQISTLGLYAKAVFVLDGIGRSPAMQRFLERFHLERALLAGGALVVLGIGIDGWILRGWVASRGGALEERVTRLAILGGTLAAVGVEIVFASFFLSILHASRTRRWV